MKPRVYQLLKILLCFSLLYFVRDWIVLAYQSVLMPVGRLLMFETEDFSCGEICSLRLIAYLALVISTPKIGIMYRSVVLLVGFAVFIGIDLAGIFLWPEAQPFSPVVGETPIQLLYSFVWNFLRDLLLPVLLWLVALDRHPGLSSPAMEIGEELTNRSSFSGS